jgi:hypothetical protein
MTREFKRQNGQLVRKTTLEIPVDIWQEIKQEMLTISGAFAAAWQARKEHLEIKTENAVMADNIRRYQRLIQDQEVDIQKLQMEVARLRK